MITVSISIIEIFPIIKELLKKSSFWVFIKSTRKSSFFWSKLFANLAFSSYKNIFVWMIVSKIATIPMIGFGLVLYFQTTLFVIVLNKVTSHWLLTAITKILGIQLSYIKKKSSKSAFCFNICFNIKCVLFFLWTAAHWVNFTLNIILINFLVKFICCSLCNRYSKSFCLQRHIIILVVI